MPLCSILQCGARKNKNQPNLTLHRFPRNDTMKRKWIEAIAIENINPRHKEWFVCSLHFEDICFNTTLDVIRLNDNSIPSIFGRSSDKQGSALIHEHAYLPKSYNCGTPTAHTLQLTPKNIETLLEKAPNKQGKNSIFDTNHSKKSDDSNSSYIIYSTSSPTGQILTVRNKTSHKQKTTMLSANYNAQKSNTLGCTTTVFPSQLTRQCMETIREKVSYEQNIPAIIDANDNVLLNKTGSLRKLTPSQATRHIVETAREKVIQAEKIKKLTEKCKQQQQKIKQLNEKVRKRNKKIATLKEILEHLTNRHKNNIPTGVIKKINYLISNITLDK